MLGSICSRRSFDFQKAGFTCNFNICYYGFMISHVGPSNHSFITQTVFIKCNCSLSKLHPWLPRRLHAGSMLSHCIGHMLMHRMHMQRVGQGWSFYTVTNVYMEGQNQQKMFVHPHHGFVTGKVCQSDFFWGGGAVNRIFFPSPFFYVATKIDPKQ